MRVGEGNVTMQIETRKEKVCLGFACNSSIAVPMHGDGGLHLPEGFKFRPINTRTDSSLCRPKLDGEEFPEGIVHDCDLYGELVIKNHGRYGKNTKDL